MAKFWNAILAAGVGTALIGVIGLVITTGMTTYATYYNSSNEHNAKMVELALGILRAAPNENVIGARSWAIRVINAHSGTTFTKEEENALLKNAIPYVPSLDFSDPRNSQYLGAIL
jgi:hypothetical protein